MTIKPFRTKALIFGGAVLILLLAGFAAAGKLPALKVSLMQSFASEDEQFIAKAQALSEEEKQTLSDLITHNQKVLTLSEEIKTLTGKDRQEAIAEIKQAAKDRKTKLADAIKTHPKIAALATLEKEHIAQLPAEVKQDVEQPVSFSNVRIEIFHTDDFKNKTGKEEYFIKSSGKQIPLVLAGSPPARSGAVANIQGVQFEGTVLAGGGGGGGGGGPVPPIQTPDSVGEQKLLVILVNFTDSAPVPFTKEEAETIIFAEAIQGYYKEASYGQAFLGGDVIGWYNLPRSGINGYGYCQDPIFYPEIPEIDEIYKLIKSDVTVANYDRVVIVPNHTCMGGGFASVGKWAYNLDGTEKMLSIAQVGATNSQSQMNHPFDFDFFDLVFIHELGHNLEAWHANTWECGTNKVLYGPCNHYEYGNGYDVMGSGNLALHFNAYYKDLFGWLNGAMTTISKSGTYTLNAIESQSGMRGAKIQIGNSAPFYLEYRQPIGFDTQLASVNPPYNTKGLFINWIQEWRPGTRLLDGSPSSATDFLDWNNAVFPGKKKYVDQTRGVTIGPVTKVDNQQITFKVNLTAPACQQNKPNVESYPSSQFPYYAYPGSINWHSFSVQNLDSPGCPNSLFKVNATTPEGWLYQNVEGKIAKKSFYLSPENYPVWFNFQVKVPEDVLPGTYEVKTVVNNLTNGKSTTQTVQYIIDQSFGPQVIVINPSAGAQLVAGKKTTVAWQTNKNVRGAKMDLKLGGENSVSNIVLNQAPNGSFSWTVPKETKEASNYYVIADLKKNNKIVSSGRSGIFSITKDKTTPAVTVTSPNGGEVWIKGNIHPITWIRNWMPTGAGGKVNVYLRGGGRQDNELIAQGVSDPQLRWQVPESAQAANDYVITVISQGTGSVLSDSSDSYFEIIPSSSAVSALSLPMDSAIKIDSPNGLEVLNGEAKIGYSISGYEPATELKMVVLLTQNGQVLGRIAKDPISVIAGSKSLDWQSGKYYAVDGTESKASGIGFKLRLMIYYGDLLVGNDDSDYVFSIF